MIRATSWNVRVFFLLLSFGALAPLIQQNASAQAVVASPASGFRADPFEVKLTSPVAGAKIYFTTNGNTPTTQKGQLYSQPIAIKTTTILRAAAYVDGRTTGEIATHTYLFLKDVPRQTGAGFPKTWGTKEGRPIPADYEMDPEIVDDPRYRDLMIRSLKSIKTASLVVDSDDLFDPERGIYSNPERSGDDWEKPASLELFGTDGRSRFQVNCGVRIQGGWNRRPEESPKHAFRVVFKKKYGPGKLKRSIFPGKEGTEFDTLILRSGSNNSWLHWSGAERARGDFIRDQWARNTMLNMGHPSASGIFVHLYLNGLYWGLYNLTERPDASFAASYFGGKREDYDAMNAEKAIEGDKTAWNKLMRLVNAGVKTDEQLRAVEAMLDLDQFIDYMIVNFYGANADWDRSSNWYASRRRAPEGKFHFFVWDAERILEKADDNTIGFDDDESPSRIFHRLRENETFRKRFADRVEIHFKEGGVLSANRAAGHFYMWSIELGTAVVAESARWGDYRRDVHPYKEGPYELYTYDRHWQVEVKRLVEEYFPVRSGIVLEQFRELGLAR